ncbi:hypothetical protein DFH11DRAFT_1250200 [Phellopilus nigrolimitatus]|nr:hypothetical protein DFH11DRAFT_1250200 [Phellopilus nigrolimitatus]
MPVSSISSTLATHSLEEFNLQTARYVVIAALTAISWDMTTNIHQDFKILKSVSVSTVVYFASRFSVLGQVLLSTIFFLGYGSSVSCSPLLSAAAWLYTAERCSTSLLFFFRVRAVYLGGRSASVFFLVLWLSVLGSCAYLPFSIETSTKFTGLRPFNWSGEGTCKIGLMGLECLTCVGAAVVYDTFVFCAISWRLLSFNANGDGDNSWPGYFCGRKELPVVSGTVFRGGKQYYIVAISSHIAAAAAMHAPGIPRDVCVALLMPYLVVQNAMACKAFRDVKIGLNEPPPSSTLSGVVFRYGDLLDSRDSYVGSLY